MDEQVKKDYEEYEKLGRIWGLFDKEGIRKIKFPRPDKGIIKQFLELEDLTSTVSDVLDSMGINGAIPASYISPVISGKKLVGPAITLRSIPERKTLTQGYLDQDFIRMATRDVYYLAEPGDVFVADYGGDLEVSNLGGQSCTVAMSCGLAGTVCNGAVRDIPAIMKMDFPVWSCGRTPMTGKFRLAAIEINGPVTLWKVTVMPGDLIVADDSGVCVIPMDKAEVVLEKLKSILSSEAHMREMIERKDSIAELKPHYRKRYK
jgi:4-hydroxy-4-methyl-2-oxoglutarate aldolase